MAEEWIEKILADIKARYTAQAEQDLREAQQAEASGYLGPAATARALEDVIAALPQAEQQAIHEDAERLLTTEPRRDAMPLHVTMADGRIEVWATSQREGLQYIARHWPMQDGEIDRRRLRAPGCWVFTLPAPPAPPEDRR